MWTMTIIRAARREGRVSLAAQAWLADRTGRRAHAAELRSIITATWG